MGIASIILAPLGIILISIGIFLAFFHWADYQMTNKPGTNLKISAVIIGIGLLSIIVCIGLQSERFLNTTLPIYIGLPVMTISLVMTAIYGIKMRRDWRNNALWLKNRSRMIAWIIIGAIGGALYLSGPILNWVINGPKPPS